MNKGAKIIICVFAVIALSVLAALLFHPAVFLGTMIGVTVSEIKNIWIE